jgi:hypothetical protein
MLLTRIIIIAMLFSLACNSPRYRGIYTTLDSSRIASSRYKIPLSLESLPIFENPPPTPTDIIELKPDISTLKTFADVDRFYKKALEDAGYTRASYFQFTKGFAMVTQMECIDKTNFLLPANERWCIMSSDQSPSSFERIISRLSTVKAGYYRCFVFLVTDVPFNTQGKNVSYDEIKSWLDRGFTGLPAEIGKKPVSSATKFHCLVYKYKKENSYRLLLEHGSCVEHLKNTKINLR